MNNWIGLLKAEWLKIKLNYKFNSFLVWILGGLIGLDLGGFLPVYACPYVGQTRGGVCFLFRLQFILGVGSWEAFKAMEKTADGWLINGKYKARLVIGAGGHFCPVARAIGSKGESELAVTAQEVEFEMTDRQKSSCTINAETPELFFTPDLKGYGWVFRKGNYLNIGLGREDKSKLSSHVEEFCHYLSIQGKIPNDITDKYNGHAYLLYPHAAREMVADHALLIGDSAGLAYPQSGEGIRPAVESAMLAADVISSCENNYSKNTLQAYHNLMEKRFGQRQPDPDFAERLPLPVKKFFAGQLMKTHWFTKNIVTDKWFLQAHQSPLPAINISTSSAP